MDFQRSTFVGRVSPAILFIFHPQGDEIIRTAPTPNKKTTMYLSHLNILVSAGDCAKPMMTYIAPGMEGRAYRITSLSFSPGGEDILVSYSSEHLYLFGVKVFVY